MKKIATLLTAFLTVITVHSQSLYNWNSVNIQGMGFVTGLVIHPNTTLAPNLVYARTDVAGAFRWDAANNRWIPLGNMTTHDKRKSQTVEAICIDPSNINRVYIMAGGTYGNNGDVLVSNNQGASWSSTGFDQVNGGVSNNGAATFRGSSGEKLCVDPSNSNNVFCGTRTRGIWKKTGTGAWQQLTNGLPSSISEPGVTFVLMDKNQNLYVGIFGFGVYKSTDGGQNFSNTNSESNPVRASLASNGKLFVSFGQQEQDYNGPGSVWRLSGSTWTDITPNGKKDLGYAGISVDPSDPNKVIIANQFRQVYRSGNEGASWEKTNFQLGYQPKYYKNQEIEWGSAALVVDPNKPSRVWNTDGYAVAKTENIWGASVIWDRVMRDFEELCVMDIRTFPGYGQADLVSMVWDMVGFRHASRDVVPEKTVVPFNAIARGSGMDFCFSKPNFMVFVGKDEVDENIPMSGYSADNGVTWTSINTSPGSGGRIAISSSNEKNMVWTPDGETTQPQYTTDAGQTWKACNGITGPWPGDGWYPAQYIQSDKVNGNKFYYYNNGTVFYSSDGGANWTKGASNLPSYKGAPHIKIHPFNEGEIWFTGLPWDNNTKIKAYKSTDGGKNFTEQTAMEYVYAVAFGKGEGYNGTYMYMSGKMPSKSEGIYQSKDNGSTWKLLTDPAKFAATMLLEGDLRYKNLIYATPAGCRGIQYGFSPEPDFVKRDTAISTTATIVTDGVLNESVWKKTNWKTINRTLSQPGSNPDNVTAKFMTRSTSNGLYLAVDVSDKKTFSGNVEPWNNSGIELYLDMLNEHAMQTDANDFQYFFTWNKTTVQERGGKIAGVTYQTSQSATGYFLEAFIPWSVLGSKNAIAGLDIAVNLNQTNSTNRTGQLMWNGTDMNWNETSQYGYLHLPTIVTSVEETTTSSASFSFFPNPVKDWLSIESSQEMEKVELFGMNGQLIFSKQLQGTSAIISLQEVPKGIYLVKMSGLNFSSTKKIVVN